MNFEELNNQLSAFGTVDFCGHNGDDQSRVVVSVLGVENTTQNIENLSSTINSFIQTEFPIVDHFQVDNGVLKAVYKIA